MWISPFRNLARRHSRLALHRLARRWPTAVSRAASRGMGLKGRAVNWFPALVFNKSNTVPLREQRFCICATQICYFSGICGLFKVLSLFALSDLWWEWIWVFLWLFLFPSVWTLLAPSLPAQAGSGACLYGSGTFYFAYHEIFLQVCWRHSIFRPRPAHQRSWTSRL